MHLKLFLISTSILLVRCAKDSLPENSCPPIPAYELPVCPKCEACPIVKHVAHCESGWTFFDSTKQCYKVGFNKDFPSAEKDCIANGAHLTSIHSEEENIFVNDLSKSGAKPADYAGLVFIGINMTDDGKWQNVDGTPTDYFNWGITEPNNYAGNEYCVLTYADDIGGRGRNWWGDVGCDWKMRAYMIIIKLAFLLAIITLSSSCTVYPCRNTDWPFLLHCEPGWTMFKETNSCYKLGSKELFVTAESVCMTMGAHLVSIRSKSENDFVNRLARTGHDQPLFLDQVWIGLNSIVGGWVWTDGSAVDYTNWAFRLPSKQAGRKCAVTIAVKMPEEKFNGTNVWINNDCYRQQRAVCKKPAKWFL